MEWWRTQGTAREYHLTTIANPACDRRECGDETRRVHLRISPAGNMPSLARRLVSMTLSEIPLTTIDGETTSLAELGDKVFVVVNVASRCGLAPQYEKLEELQKTYASRGFSVLGFPSNQFLQELGTEDAIKEYCSTTWGVTFPMFEKTRVNGKRAHPLYAELTKTPDAAGKSGRVAWNFEKFVITRSGNVHRFRPTTEPDAPEIVSLIESSLAGATQADN